MDDASEPHPHTASSPGIAWDGQPLPPEPAPAGGDMSRPVRLGAVPLRDPAATDAWLHVVSAATVPVLSRAVFELAAQFLAGGHRVLLVDASPRLRLHDRFGRESRWGVVECLGGMPVLGLVQDAGRFGLYLLAHGDASRPAEWSRLESVLDEARPHFGRAVLAVDPAAPAAIGAALAGVHLEGWWPQGAREARRAAGTGGRLAVPFSDLSLDHLLVPRPEALEARLWQLVAPPGDPAAAAPATGASPAAVPDSAEMESDPRVRERLRFLLWMRRVEAEGARSPVPTLPAADGEPS